MFIKLGGLIKNKAWFFGGVSKDISKVHRVLWCNDILFMNLALKLGIVQDDVL